MYASTANHARPGDAPEGTSPPEPPADALGALLGAIVAGSFVLTDGQGAISRWGDPPALLFGLEAGAALGHGLFDRLVADAPDDAAAWRGFLEAGEDPGVPAPVAATARHGATGHRFGIELVFVPVALDEGFDFSLFLEELGAELPLGVTLGRLRHQHPAVARALGAAVGDAPRSWEGRRPAGTLVAFRPTEPTPWIEEAPQAREQERAEAEARLLNHDPGIQGETVADLDDAATVVARLLGAMERIEGLERRADGLGAALEEACADARDARERAAAAEVALAQLRGEVHDGLAAAGHIAEVGRRDAGAEKAEIEGAHRHDQRRMVPVAGELRLVRDPDGGPAPPLLTAQGA